jgi:hypothetical protein
MHSFETYALIYASIFTTLRFFRWNDIIIFPDNHRPICMCESENVIYDDCMLKICNKINKHAKI